MKTVLLVCNKVPHYRVGVYNYLCQRFLESGWQFKVASNAMQRENKLEVKFEFYQVDFSFSKYRALIQRLGPDAVMLHLHLKIPLFWCLIHWLKLKRIPVICWTKGANLDRPDSRWRYHLFNYAHGLSDALILYSQNEARYISPAFRERIFVANNTVNLQEFPEVKETKE